VAWGDPHSHTGYSDGFTTATPDAAFAYARDVMRLDFAAVTDHLEAIWGCPMTDAQRADLAASADRFNEDGRFIAFAGYEWTASFPFGGVESETEGHAHVLFDGEPAWCASTEPRCSTFASLVETLRPLNPVIVRHHTCASWAPALFMPVGDNLTPVVEIASSHGSCECGDCPGRMPDSTDNPDNSTRRWLASGRLYGLVGGSDNHHARPGATRFFRHGDIILDAGGLSAVRADSLTRRPRRNAPPRRMGDDGCAHSGRLPARRRADGRFRRGGRHGARAFRGPRNGHLDPSDDLARGHRDAVFRYSLRRRAGHA
jgi:hypothetical protein